jgi:hypothetical protein
LRPPAGVRLLRNGWRLGSLGPPGDFDQGLRTRSRKQSTNSGRRSSTGGKCSGGAARATSSPLTSSRRATTRSRPSSFSTICRDGPDERPESSPERGGDCCHARVADHVAGRCRPPAPRDHEVPNLRVPHSVLTWTDLGGDWLGWDAGLDRAIDDLEKPVEALRVVPHNDERPFTWGLRSSESPSTTLVRAMVARR